MPALMTNPHFIKAASILVVVLSIAIVFDVSLYVYLHLTALVAEGGLAWPLVGLLSLLGGMPLLAVIIFILYLRQSSVLFIYACLLAAVGVGYLLMYLTGSLPAASSPWLLLTLKQVSLYALALWVCVLIVRYHPKAYD